MPATVNGVGTMYYGRRKARTYTAECESCHRVQELSDYETTYFFVVLFIPLIPLGKKQIFADCPRCRRHRVMPLAEWQKIEEQSLTQGAKSLGENPDDPHAALELLRSFSAFSRFEEAEKLAQGIQTQYDDNAEVQTAIGHWHEYRNRPGEAAACFRKAQELEPANVAAKCGVVRSLLREGRTKEAQSLADASPRLAAGNDVGLFVELGRAHQREGDHPSALTAFWAALEVAPQLGHDGAFRKLVRASEKQVPGQPSMLKGWSPGQRRVALVTSIAALVIGVLAYVNYHIATHRELHLVNGFDVPLAVQLDERPAVTVEPQGRITVPVAEGAHHAVVTREGRQLDEGSFELSTPYASRFFSTPVFVYNMGGGAPVIWEQTTYAVKPVDEGLTKVSLQAGLVQFDDVDFVFQEFPATLKLQNGNSTKRTRVGIAPIRSEQIVFVPSEMASADDRLGFLERHLKLEPDSKAAVQAYVSLAASEQQLERARIFIGGSLDDLPLKVEWHRVSEFLARSPEEREALKRRYEKLIAEDPNNAAALYLLGRLQPVDSALALFDRATAADPESAYPWQAKAYLQRTTGDFAAAKASYERALELHPDDEELRSYYLDVMFAAKAYDELEEEVRLDLLREGTRIDLHLRLLALLAAQNKLPEARQANERYIELMQSDMSGFGPQAIGLATAALHYLERNLNAVLEDANTYSLAGGENRLRYQAHLELGQLDAAGESLQAAEGDGFDMLHMSVAWALNGNAAKAREWQARARSKFAEGNDDHQLADELLKDPTKATWMEAQQVQLEPAEKSILLLAIALQQPPEQRAELLSLADRMNYSLGAPHYFRERAIAVLRAKKPE